MEYLNIARAWLLKTLPERIIHILRIIRDALKSFTEARGAQAAAGLSYYALFSLFPLLLLAVAGGSYIIESQQVFDRLTSLADEAIPGVQVFVEKNLQQVIQQRGAVSLIGLAGLLWSASGVFSAVVYNISLAWSHAKPLNFLQQRLSGMGMVLALATLLVLSVSSSTLARALPNLNIPLRGSLEVYETLAWRYLSWLGPWLLLWATFTNLYYWAPRTNVPRLYAALSGLVATVLWQGAASIFTWYLKSGLGRYDLVYGSLGALVALMIFIYIGNWIVLFGAHLCAAMSQPTPSP